jgi:hypothetical protein
MIKIVHYVLDFLMIFGGIFSTLLGFNLIKFKITKLEDQKKMELWHQKFDKLMKILGILLIVLGIFNLITLIFDL